MASVLHRVASMKEANFLGSSTEFLHVHEHKMGGCVMKLRMLVCLLSLANVCHAAAISSNGTGGGKWSETTTWAGAVVPGPGDSVTILVGDVVLFDVDMSGWVDGIAGLTCNGTIHCSTAAGTYCLKTSADIGGTGTIHCGSAETAYPLACSMTFDFAATPSSFECQSGLVLNLHCTEPIHPVIALSEDEVAGQTELSVDTDVTGDMWTPGKIVRIDAVSDRVPDSEKRAIGAAGITSNTVTLDTGLAADKGRGALLVLVSRNIRIVGSTEFAVRYMTGGVLACEITDCLHAVGVPSGSLVSGTISGCTYGVVNPSGCTVCGAISGCTYGVNNPSGGAISGTISGCTYGVNNPSGCAIWGTIAGCTSGVNQGASCMVSGTIEGCGTGIFAGAHTIRDAVFVGNSYDLRRVVSISAYNTLFGSMTENYDYDTDNVPLWTYVASYDHDAVADAFKAWTRGGVVISDTDTAPPGYATSYRHICSSSAAPCFRQELITVGPSQTLDVSGKILILDTHDLWAPRLELVDVRVDPLVDAGALALASALIPEPRGRYYWQDLSVQYTNANGMDKQVWIRCSARQSGTDVYEVWDARLQ